MKKRLASGFLIALLFTALSQLFPTSAQQDNKTSSHAPQVEPAKTKPADTPVKTKASVDDKTPTAKPNESQPQKPKDDKITLGTDIVNVIVSVTDPYGRFVTGLAKDHFDVYDDKVKQQIAHFTDEDSPVSLGIVYDVSGSSEHVEPVTVVIAP